MEFKGTKGNWVFDKEGVFTDNRLSYGNIVCLAPVEWTASNVNWTYNALLISKAPEMLEMLKMFYNTNSSHEITLSELQDRVGKLIKEAT